MTDVTLTIGDERLAGWTEAEVDRSIETVAGTFRVRLSDPAPGVMAPRDIRPGERCQVALGGEQVIDGYIDAVRPAFDAGSHGIEVDGRDATGDLVDCSAASEPGEWSHARLEQIAAELARPFGIPVHADADTSPPFRKFRIEEGETVFEAIERGCRFRGLLPLSDGAGGLVLGLPGRARAGARLSRPGNILEASGESSWGDRFSHYTLLGQQPGDDFLGVEDTAHVIATATDEGVRRRGRYRPLTILAEQALDKAEAKARVEWEASVRTGRSRRITVTVQGWRELPDEGSPLWAPGRLARITDDWLGLDTELLIAGVRQAIGDGGTTTTLTLFPEAAFLQRAKAEPAEPKSLFPEPLRPPPEVVVGTGWWG